MTAINRSRPF